jgi:succinate dehydrogenase/fumarate reductase cytochrome b subunit
MQPAAHLHKRPGTAIGFSIEVFFSVFERISGEISSLFLAIHVLSLFVSISHIDIEFFLDEMGLEVAPILIFDEVFLVRR